MEKKSTIISLISLAIIVAVSCAYIIFSGITTKDFNYVQLEVNPRVEFICDKKFNVVSVSPLNSDARIVLSDLDLIGLDIQEASNVFLDECAKTGYIDVNGIDNATNITVIDGITQALDVHVTQNIYDYFKENEIMSAVTETYEVRDIFDKKKEAKVCCSNKYKLLITMTEKNPDNDFNTLKKLSEADLVEKVAEEHKENKFQATEDEINLKKELIEKNKDKYNKHMKSITEHTQQEFSELFNKYQKLSTKQHMNNFDKVYSSWQENRN